MNQQNRRKTIRCSFCSKPEKKVRMLVRGSKALICDECVELCHDIVSEETEPERWGSGTVMPEIGKFQKKTNNCVGWSENRVLRTFGQPDKVTKGGMESRDLSGRLLFRVNRSLVYLSLLPHVTVHFGLADRKVRTVVFVPKPKNSLRQKEDGDTLERRER